MPTDRLPTSLSRIHPEGKTGNPHFDKWGRFIPTTDKRLIVGSTCILKFLHHHEEEGSRLLDSIRKAEAEFALEQVKRLFARLKETSAFFQAPNKENPTLTRAEDFFQFFEKHRIFSPYQLYCVARELPDEEKDYLRYLKTSIRKDKYKEQFLSLSAYALQLIWHALSPSQRKRHPFYEEVKPLMKADHELD